MTAFPSYTRAPWKAAQLHPRGQDRRSGPAFHTWSTRTLRADGQPQAPPEKHPPSCSPYGRRLKGEQGQGQPRTVLPLSVLLRGPCAGRHAYSQCVWPSLEGPPDHLLCTVHSRPNPPPWFLWTQVTHTLGEEVRWGLSEPKAGWPAGPGWRGPGRSGRRGVFRPARRCPRRPRRCQQLWPWSGDHRVFAKRIVIMFPFIFLLLFKKRQFRRFTS